MAVHNGRDLKRFGQSCIHSARMPNADGRARTDATVDIRVIGFLPVFTRENERSDQSYPIR